jgi:putative endonuclease
MQEVIGSTPIFSTRPASPDFFYVMTFHVYILYSKYLDQYYVGQTDDLEDRLFRHRNSGSKSTKKAKDWDLKYTEPYPTRSAAVKRESEIKKKKSRKYIETLIAG